MTISRQCELCQQPFPTRYKLINHLKREHMTSWYDYVLATAYAGSVPLCKCGCGKPVTSSKTLVGDLFGTYVHGHNGVGKSPSVEVRQNIGRKNSANMKRYHAEHPEQAHAKAARMREFLTDDVIANRSESIRQTYNTNPELCVSLREGTQQFWANNPQKREEASRKSSETYKARAKEGKYEATNQHLSEVMTNKLLRGERIWQRGMYKARKCAKLCRFKSSYEITVMKALDRSRLVKKWDYECVAIPYIDETGLKTRRYTPDFLITLCTGKIIMLEAKPSKLTKHPRIMCKIKAGQAFCDKEGITYVLWWPKRMSINALLASYLRT